MTKKNNSRPNNVTHSGQWPTAQQSETAGELERLEELGHNIGHCMQFSLRTIYPPCVTVSIIYKAPGLAIFFFHSDTHSDPATSHNDIYPRRDLLLL